MKKKYRMIAGVIFVMGIVSVLAGLFAKKETMPVEPVSVAETQKEPAESAPVVPEGEQMFLQELLQCDEAHAVEIAKCFEKISGNQLDEAELIPTGKKSKLLKVTTSGKVYYLKISSVNTLNEIREDAQDGNIIYQIIY